MKQYILFFWLMSYASVVGAQVMIGTKPSTLPLVLTEAGNFAIKALVNHTDTVLLMVHTAESGLTLTATATKRMGSLRFSGADSVESWGGKGNTSRYSENNTLQMGDLTWNKLLVWEDVNSGKGTDGKFGLDLFKGRAVEVDFDKRQLVVGANLADTVGYERHALKVQKSDMFIEGTCLVGDSAWSTWFLIHTGYAGSLLLDDAFVAAHSLDARLTITDEKELKDSYGHVLKVQKATLPGFRIGATGPAQMGLSAKGPAQPGLGAPGPAQPGLGNMVLKDLPVGFFHGAISQQKMSILGAEVLKKFNFILSADRNWIYLKPNGTT
jgi:hypothetical protein